jgi:hypothetical protein
MRTLKYALEGKERKQKNNLQLMVIRKTHNALNCCSHCGTLPPSVCPLHPSMTLELNSDHCTRHRSSIFKVP